MFLAEPCRPKIAIASGVSTSLGRLHLMLQPGQRHGILRHLEAQYSATRLQSSSVFSHLLLFSFTSLMSISSGFCSADFFLVSLYRFQMVSIVWLSGQKICNVVKSANVVARYGSKWYKPVFEKSHADFLPRASKSVKRCSPQHKSSWVLFFCVFLVYWRLSSICPFIQQVAQLSGSISCGKRKEPFNSPGFYIQPCVIVRKSACFFRVFHMFFLFRHLFMYGRAKF